MLTSSSCDRRTQSIGDGLDRLAGGGASVSPLTRAWTWFPISTSISGSHSQLSDVIASSSIGRNSRATGLWISASSRDGRVGLAGLRDRLVDVRPARVLQESVDIVTVAAALAGSAKPA